MKNKKIFWVFIPARSGSKAIKDKNINDRKKVKMISTKMKSNKRKKDKL